MDTTRLAVIMICYMPAAGAAIYTATSGAKNSDKQEE
jgi:hypothetical protein